MGRSRYFNGIGELDGGVLGKKHVYGTVYRLERVVKQNKRSCPYEIVTMTG